MSQKIFQIEWVDSNSFTGGSWISKAEIANLKVCSCVSVGIIIGETDDVVALAGSWGGEGKDTEYAGVIVIPKVAITKRSIVGGK